MSKGPSEKRYQQECTLDKNRRLDKIEEEEMKDESKKGFWVMELTGDPEKCGMVEQTELPPIKIKRHS